MKNDKLYRDYLLDDIKRLIWQLLQKVQAALQLLIIKVLLALGNHFWAQLDGGHLVVFR